MQYMLLIYSDDSMNQFEKLSEAEQNAILGEYYAISENPAVSETQACTGKVMLTIKRGGRSILNQEVSLSKRCTFSRSVTAKGGSQSFSAKVTFGGNTVLNTTGQNRRFS